MRISAVVTSLLVVSLAHSIEAVLIPSKAACKSSATIECNVEGEDSPEAALRQADAHALRSMYCTTGCDYAVNHATPHAFSTYIKPVCSVEKEENQIEFKKYNSSSKDDKRRWTRGKERRDIDAYTVGSAKLTFCCTDQNGVDYTEAVGCHVSPSCPHLTGTLADTRLIWID